MEKTAPDPITTGILTQSAVKLKDSEALTVGINTETELRRCLWGVLSGAGRCEGTSSQTGGLDGGQFAVAGPAAMPSLSLGLPSTLDSRPAEGPRLGALVWQARGPTHAPGPKQALEVLLDVQSLPHSTLAKPRPGCQRNQPQRTQLAQFSSH